VKQATAKISNAFIFPLYVSLFFHESLGVKKVFTSCMSVRIKRIVLKIESTRFCLDKIFT